MVSASLRLKWPPWEHLQSRGRAWPGGQRQSLRLQAGPGGRGDPGRPGVSLNKNAQTLLPHSTQCLTHVRPVHTCAPTHTYDHTENVRTHTPQTRTQRTARVCRHASTPCTCTHTCTRVGTSADQAPLSRQHMVQRLTAQFCQLGTIRVGSLSRVKCCRI